MNTEYMMTNLELAILGLVAENPSHGYRIEAVIVERGMREWTDIGFSSIYQALKKLETAGLLESELSQEGPGPARKVFHLTRLGKAGLAASVTQRLSEPRIHSGDFDLALANLPAIPTPVAEASLQHYHQLLSNKLDQVKAKKNLDEDFPLPLYVQALFDHGLTMMEAELAWIEKWQEKLIQFEQNKEL